MRVPFANPRISGPAVAMGTVDLELSGDVHEAISGLFGSAGQYRNQLQDYFSRYLQIPVFDDAARGEETIWVLSFAVTEITAFSPGNGDSQPRGAQRLPRPSVRLLGHLFDPGQGLVLARSEVFEDRFSPGIFSGRDASLPMIEIAATKLLMELKKTAEQNGNHQRLAKNRTT